MMTRHFWRVPHWTELCLCSAWSRSLPPSAALSRDTQDPSMVRRGYECSFYCLWKSYLCAHSLSLSSDLDWSAANDFIASASSDGTCRLWNSRSGVCLRVFTDAAGARTLCCRFPPNNNNLIVVSLNIISLDQKKWILSLAHGSRCISLSFSIFIFVLLGILDSFTYKLR